MKTQEIYALLESEVNEYKRLVAAEKQAKKDYDQMLKDVPQEQHWNPETGDTHPEIQSAEDKWHAAHLAAGEQGFLVDAKLSEAIQNSEVPYAKTRNQMYDKFWKMAGIK